MVTMLKAVIASCLLYGWADATDICGESNNYVPTTRNYCIMLAEEQWDYARNYPHVEDGLTDDEIDDDLALEFGAVVKYQLNNDAPKMGRFVYKGVLKEYNYDEGACNWESPVETNPRNGFLGPVIRVVTGDTVNVHFYNNAEILYTDDTNDGDDDNIIQNSTIFNLYPRGLNVESSYGISYLDEITYTWTVSNEAAPGSKYSTKLYSYSSNAYEDVDYPSMDFNAGVFGPIVVVNPAYLVTHSQQREAKPCDVDEEVYVGLVEQNEANSVYYKYNLHSLFGKKFHSKYREEKNHALPNVKYSINGHMYGNLNAELGMEFKYHARIRWNVFSLNSSFIPLECDEHCQENEDETSGYVGPEAGMGTLTINWEQGTSVTTRSSSSRGNSFTIGPTESTTFDMVPVSAGVYRFWVSDYDKLGMFANFSVYDDGSYVESESVTSDESTSGAAVALITVGSIMLVAALVTLFVVVKRPQVLGLSDATYCASNMDDSSAGLNSGTPKSDNYREYITSHSESGPQHVVCSWCGDMHINGAQNCAKMLTFLKEHPEARQGVVATPKEQVMV